MALIGQADSEEKIFEIVDRRTDGRTPDHGHPMVSYDVKFDHVTKLDAMLFMELLITFQFYRFIKTLHQKCTNKWIHNQSSHSAHMSSNMKKPTIWCPNRSNTNRAAQAQERLEILDLESRGIVLSVSQKQGL